MYGEEIMKPFADLHTHTKYSHGKGSIEQNVLAALEKGLSAIGISEHGPANIGIGVKIDKFFDIKEEILRLRKIYDIDILFGCEANIISIDGKLDIPEKLLLEFDYIMAGLHPLVWAQHLRDYYHILLKNLIAKRFKSLREKVINTNTNAVINAIKYNNIDIITHPGLHLPIDTAKLAKVAAKHNTALEINSGHAYMTVEYARIAKNFGVKFAIGSDAHDPKDVANFSRGIMIAQEAGVMEADIINVGGGEYGGKKVCYNNRAFGGW